MKAFWWVILMCLQGEFLGKGWRKLGLHKILEALRENLCVHMNKLRL
jgi:hypothetical protein